MTPADNLLPCPFCGGQPEGPQNLTGSVWLVKCASRLRHDAHAMSWVSAEDAIAAWNTRAAIRAELGEAVPVASVEWRWIDDQGRAMTNWKAGEPPPIRELSDNFGKLHIEVRTTSTPPASVPVEALRELAEKWHKESGPKAEQTAMTIPFELCASELTALTAAQEKP